MTSTRLHMLIAFAIALTLGFTMTSAALAQETRIVVDVRPEGNEPTEPGPAYSCREASVGEVFEVDVLIHDVVDLLAWEMYVEYDPQIVSLVQRDVRLFQSANPGSAVYDVSAALPDETGLYRLGAADTADPPSPDTGSGVLARLTLEAVANGSSQIALPRRDVTGDGVRDIGPFMRDVDGDPIGNAAPDGRDAFFDGPVEEAMIVVGGSCPAQNPPAQPPTENSSGLSANWTTIGVMIAIAATATLGAAVLWKRRGMREGTS